MRDSKSMGAKDGLKPGHGAETFQCAAHLGGGGDGGTEWSEAPVGWFPSYKGHIEI